MGDLKIKEWLQASQWNRRNFAALLRETARLQNYLADLIEEDPKSNLKVVDFALKDQLDRTIRFAWDTGRERYIELKEMEDVDLIKELAFALETTFLVVHNTCMKLQEQRAREEANCGA